MKKVSFPIETIEAKVDELPVVQRVLVLVITVLALAAAFYYFQYAPQNKRMQQLRASIQSQEKRLATLKKYASESEKLAQEVRKAEEEFASMLKVLPDQREIPALLETVSQIGAQEGLENLLFQPLPEVPHEFHATIPVRLDLVGRYHQLGLFLDRISRLGRIIQVDNLALKRRNDSSVQVSCQFSTYRFLEEHERKKPAAKKK
ncbi:type IV pilus inner membrane component PilO [Desulfosoma caldarium]|uniref:Type IV pilus assembly protein PilO n=1 Tax=Desulfosoma caldarium TaxID=610254 RepID=A0A3N1VT86_9BACT|nr:type 4a pilus biogenesis protein PilO [Desulfosoma caldarium]ROR03047.1 type IV pilus assembly protein PilO [Desulfosoma caldarium]